MRKLRNQSAKVSYSKVEVPENKNTQKKVEHQRKSSSAIPGKRLVRTALSSRQHHRDKMNSSVQFQQFPLENKIPVMRNLSNDEVKKQKIRKLEKLGLEDFMKELIVENNLDYSYEIIEALNKTYIQEQSAASPLKSMPTSFSRKSQTQIFKSPRVQWNPEKDTIFKSEFNDLQSYIPSKMFPCRKQKTSQLKVRNFGIPLRPNSVKKINTFDPLEELQKQISLKWKQTPIKSKHEKTRQYFHSKRRSYDLENMINGKKVPIYH